MTDCIIYLAAATSASISGCFVIQIQCPFILNLLQHSIESKHEVTILSGLNEFVVKFYGQQGSKCLILWKCFCPIYLLTAFCSRCHFEVLPLIK